MLKRIIAGLSVSIVLFSSALQAEPNQATQQQVEKLIDSMTIEEKVGQMTLIASYIFSDSEEGQPRKIDLEKLRTAIHKYKVGAFLNPPQEPYSPQEWHKWLEIIQNETAKTDKKIPILFGVDSIHGATFVKDATLLPHNIGVAASRNIKAAKKAAEITGNETLATGVYWNYDPVLDVARQPLWPRFEETFGEDTHLVTEMGVAMVKQYESMGIASTMKHFVGYGVPANGKDRTPAFIDDRSMWQTHLPPFKAAVDAGAASVMINSGSVNGIPGHANKHLLTDILREKWGFDGLIVTDWEDIVFLNTRHNIAPTVEEAIKIALDAGIDMSMVPSDFSFAEQLTKLVKSGEVSEERLDQSVRVILNFKHRIGLFTNPYPNKSYLPEFNKAEYSQQALELANETLTLVKNDNQVLPLKKSQKVLLAGPAANNLGALHGSWSYGWQGHQYERFPKHIETIADSMKAYLDADNLTVLGNGDFESAENTDVRALVKAAQDVDVIVLALGEKPYAEQPGLIHDLMLAQEQLDLAQAAFATGKPVVLVMAEGRPRVISPIADGADAILLAFRPGSRGGDAITQTLFGDNNPSGVLPFSYPRYSGDVVPYDHVISARVAQRVQGQVTYDAYNPQWPFGHGLSYTKFSVSKPKVSAKKFSKGDTLTVKVKVKNKGKLAGKKAIDLYISDHFASESPAVKRLKHFKKVSLKAGKSTTVKFTLTEEDFSFVNNQLQTVIEPGTFSIEVEGQTVDVEYVK
jgi:beta-glucosidase